jgi:hypothetical protein
VGRNLELRRCAYGARLDRQSLRSLADGPPRKPRRCGRARGTLESRWPRAFVGSEVTRPVTILGPEPAKFRLPGERSNLDGPEGPSVSDEGARFFTTRNCAPRIRGFGFRGNGCASLARRPSTTTK